MSPRRNKNARKRPRLGEWQREEPTGDCDWNLIAVKRRWVPEWLWWVMGNWPVYQPFRWLLTTTPEDSA